MMVWTIHVFSDSSLDAWPNRIYTTYLENHIAIFFYQKAFVFFLSKTGLCQTRYFSNMRVRFFPQHVEKIRVYCGSAPLLTSNTNPNTHMVIFLDIVGFTRNRQKIVNIVSQVYVCIYTYLLHIGTIEIWIWEKTLRTAFSGFGSPPTVSSFFIPKLDQTLCRSWQNWPATQLTNQSICQKHFLQMCCFFCFFKWGAFRKGVAPQKFKHSSHILNFAILGFSRESGSRYRGWSPWTCSESTPRGATSTGTGAFNDVSRGFILEATNSPVWDKGRSVEIQYLWKISKWWLRWGPKDCKFTSQKSEALPSFSCSAAQAMTGWLDEFHFHSIFSRLWSREAWIAKEAAHVSNPIFSIKSVTNAIVLYK